MLSLSINIPERWDEKSNLFIKPEKVVIKLEHSLLSISKWEMIYEKPFLDNKKKTFEETINYIKCMTIGEVNPVVYDYISNDNINIIIQYIGDKMTATTINDKDKRVNRETITSEIIYYWMISFGIPMECQEWHLNRLLTLIKICSVKNAPPKKMSKNEILSRNKSLNKSRLKKFNTHG